MFCLASLVVGAVHPKTLRPAPCSLLQGTASQESADGRVQGQHREDDGQSRQASL